MRNMVVIIGCIALLICMLFAFGCKKDVVDEDVVEAPQFIELSELNGYRIVRGENEDKDTIRALADFRIKLKEEYKLDVSLMVDVDAPASEKEILIGTTDRSQSTNPRYSDYSVDYRDGKFFINGGSGDAISAAIDWFCSCISDGKLYLDKMPYEYNAEYPLENVTVHGVALGEFAIENVNASAANELHKWLGPQAGLRKESQNGYTIKIEGDYSLYLDEISTRFEEKTLVLSSSACLDDLSLVTNYFKERIEKRKSGAVSLKTSVTVDLPKPASTVKDVRKATGSTKIVSAVTDKDPLAYKIGDNVVFSCTLYADKTVVSCPKFWWSATTEDGKTYTGNADGAYGKLVVKIPTTAKGVVRLKVMVQDENGSSISEVTQSSSWNEPVIFSAVVNASDITTKVAEPSDFDAFWSQQLAKLDVVAPDVISMEKITSSKSVKNIDGGSSKLSVDIYKLKIKAPDECGFVSAYLTVPQNANPGSLGIVVTFISYGVGDVTPHASASNMVLTVSPHSIELNMDSSYYSDLKNGTLKDYGFTNNSSADTCYFRTMIMRDVQALRFIKAYGGTSGVDVNGSNQALGLWNGKTLKLYGGSQGAFQGIAVAAFDKDVTDAQWSIPWMCDVNGMKSEFRPVYTDALRYFDTVFFGKRIGANVNVTISAGLGDYVSPPSGVVALFNQMGGKVTLTFEQGMTHGFYPENAAVYKYEK